MASTVCAIILLSDVERKQGETVDAEAHKHIGSDVRSSTAADHLDRLIAYALKCPDLAPGVFAYLRTLRLD